MTEIQAQIIEMLKEGMSYSTIQEELRVSSKTISATKKAFMETENSSNSRLFSTHFQKVPDPPPRQELWESTYNATSKADNFKPLKPKTTMTNYIDEVDDDEYDDDDEQITKLSLEKLRLKLEHEREMQKLDAVNEKEAREYYLKEREIQLKRDEFEAVKEKKAEEMRSLLFRLKKLTQQCEDGEYTYDEVETMYDGAEVLLTDCEKYCFINQIRFDETESHTILSGIISTFDEFLDNTDEGDSNDLEFDENLEEIISKATFRKF
jgi:endoglucanase Acf2